MRKSRICSIVLLFMFLAAVPSLYAFGRREEVPELQPVNTEFVLLITAFDVSALAPARQLMGETVMRNLAASLSKVNYRFRGEEEIAHYRDYAWENSRAAAARELQAKRNERDLLLFRGEAAWRYRRDVRAIDAAIVELERQMAEVSALAPVVEERPVFSLSERNRDGVFPPPPAMGEELRFAAAQGVDAFLVGSLSEFHDRIYLEARVFTLHTNSFSYEYSILFSSADLVMAMDEISNSLVAAVSGALPAGIIVHATPPDATVLIDGVLAGRAGMDMHTHFPGEVEIEIRADNYAPVLFPLTLYPGELAEVFIDLTPLSLSAFEVIVPDSPGSRVYLGALYVGETPLMLHLPRSQFAYISVETPEGEIGTFIYRDDEIVRGSARFASPPGVSVNGMTAIVDTRLPIAPEEMRVERGRRGFYRAYGALWFILPASLLTAGIAATYINANNYTTMTGHFHDDPGTQRRVYNNARRAQNARIAAFSVMGVSLGITFFQLFRYLRAASADPTPIVPVTPLVPAAEALTEEP